MEEKRAYVRFPYTSPVSYVVMGEPPHPPEKVAIHSEMVDLSNGGMRIREGRLKEGVLIRVGIPVSEHEVMLPVLAEVRWVREEIPGEYQAGLQFLM